MKSVFWMIVCVLLAGGAGVPLTAASTEEAEIYFNAGTERYLQGDFTGAIENLDKAQALNPGKTKIREFMVKILLEGATQNHLNRNYRQAMVYLQKARSIEPGSQKVQEMYQLTAGLLTPVKEEVPVKEKVPAAIAPAAAPSPARETTVPSSPRERAPAVVLPARKKNTSAAQGSIPQKPLEYPSARGTVPGVKGAASRSALPWFLGSIVLMIGMCGALLVQSRRLKEARKTIESQAKDVTRLFEEKSRFLAELEKAREGLRYEHQIAENAQRELKEIRKKEEERYRLEMNYRSMQDTCRKAPGGSLRREEEQFVQYVNDSTRKDAEMAPAIESTRERIALMAQNLFEYAPGTAIDFLKKMARDEHPLIRSNIVMALSRIARTETIEILVELASDADERVKREVLRHGKLVQQRIDAGVLPLEPAVRERLAVLLSQEKKRGEWIF